MKIKQGNVYRNYYYNDRRVSDIVFHYNGEVVVKTAGWLESYSLRSTGRDIKELVLSKKPIVKRKIDFSIKDPFVKSTKETKGQYTLYLDAKEYGLVDENGNINTSYHLAYSTTLEKDFIGKTPDGEKFRIVQSRMTLDSALSTLSYRIKNLFEYVYIRNIEETEKAIEEASTLIKDYKEIKEYLDGVSLECAIEHYKKAEALHEAASQAKNNEPVTFEGDVKENWEMYLRTSLFTEDRLSGREKLILLYVSNPSSVEMDWTKEEIISYIKETDECYEQDEEFYNTIIRRYL